MIHGAGDRLLHQLHWVVNSFELFAFPNTDMDWIIQAERGPQYTGKVHNNLTGWPTSMPSGRNFIYSHRLRRFSWLSPEEALAMNGLRIQDWFPAECITSPGFFERFHMFDFQRFSGNAFDPGSCGCFKEAVLLLGRCADLGDRICDKKQNLPGR